MTIDLPVDLEKALHHLAHLRGETIDQLVEEAVQQYLDSASITDITAADIGSTQEALLGELGGVPGWSDCLERDFDSANDSDTLSKGMRNISSRSRNSTGIAW